jgi:hypothetical protein
MNVENINRVADAIEASCAPDAKPEIGFNMAWWYGRGYNDQTGHNCGTTACIAGWAVLELGGDIDRVSERVFATRAFDLDWEEAEELFTPVDPWPRNHIEAPHAVAVLRHLAKTGVVDWTVGAPQTEEPSR